MKKIAILGGGMASLSAAYWLTSKPGWEAEHEITVYQLGWRLGGKAASGRNQGASQRTEEHGFHMLFGFYENVFATMVGCYQALGRGPDEPLAEFCANDPADEQRFPERYAVLRNSQLFLAQEFNGASRSIHFDFPTNTSVPGDGEDPNLWIAFLDKVDWLIRFATDPTYARSRKTKPTLSSGLLASIARFTVGAAAEAFSFAVQELQDHVGLLHLARKALESLPRGVREHLATAYRYTYDVISGLIKCYLEWLWNDVKDEIHTDWSAYAAWILQDFVGTNVIGFLEDNVPEKGFDSLNGENYYAWLMRHGAVPEGTQITVGSVIVQFAYDACFGFAGGDAVSPPTPEKPLRGAPNMEAGTLLRGGMRLFLTYKGSVDWLFQSGCGDAIAAPMYQLLRRRGVRFELFHKTLGLGLSSDETAIETIRMERQVTLNVGEYQPLILVEGLPSWPSEPLYAQLVQGRELEALHVDLESSFSTWKGEELTLERGRDFDLVLLGIPVAALPALTGELAAANAGWRRMLDEVKTTRTFGFQTWLNESTEELGWTRGNIAADTGAEPCGMEAEATQVIARESWPMGSIPRNLTYFGGVMKDDPRQPLAPDPSYPATQQEVIEQVAVSFLNEHAGIYWPKSVTSEGFRWEILVDVNDPGKTGPERFRSQFWKANIDPSERYVLSVVGSTQHRIEAGATGFSNLIVAGDWIKTELNCGCMEATFMSGMEASQAICGYPKSILGEDGFSGKKWIS